MTLKKLIKRNLVIFPKNLAADLIQKKILKNFLENVTVCGVKMLPQMDGQTRPKFNNKITQMFFFSLLANFMFFGTQLAKKDFAK
ncbi:hypothetical protein RFI_10782 [Reticulomyxa filosa]|uniref:Uncharacterized protein n=1 Tax=Reticulomyxa filosa TaxID=46433 RepID=X6NKB6_RETFI|nr:hypothetical protein RFI_10782 [Reticulomyxa filosa]|eukprot:ETO26353.1 hypothetical protein RFI_10782 [Reticulomyxa filosa]